jgi:hypothetical protein
MKINLLAAGAFAAALAMPLGAPAQQAYPQGAHAHRQRTTPSEAKMQRRWAKRTRDLNLSSDQQQRMQSLIDQYAQTHPAGSPRDVAGSRQLHQQLLGLMTSDQQNQFRQEGQARRAAMRQRRAQMQQQGPNGQPYPGQGYQGQGYQGQGYQQAPPDQQYQQGPPDQQYQPYQQGPPQQQQPPQ